MRKFVILSVVVLVGSLTISAVFGAIQSNNQFNAGQVKAIQGIVHDYLVKNPQVLVEASEALQQQELAKVEQKAESAIESNADTLFNSPASPTVGNKKGPVTLVEFFDYQCPHCKQMASVVEKLMQSDSDLRVVMKELPIFGGNSKEAALAALATYKTNPDKYLDLHNALMKTENPLTPKKIENIVKAQGLNWDKIEKAMKDPTLNHELQANFKLAQELGIIGTPSFVIGNQNASKKGNSAFIPGATTKQNLQKLIAKLKPHH